MFGAAMALGYQGEPAALPSQQTLDPESSPRQRAPERIRAVGLGNACRIRLMYEMILPSRIAQIRPWAPR
jgi:hypothetical protein